MKSKIIIYGMGNFADILSSKLEREGIEIDGYTVNSSYFSQENYHGKRVYLFEELHQYFDPRHTSIYIGVIGKQMLKYRKEIFQEVSQKGYLVPNYISKTAVIASDKIGNGNIIMDNVVIGEYCCIGNGNLIWPNVVLPHHNRIGDFNNLSPSVSLSGYSKIENRCFIGNNACINNHVQIQDCALVGAGVYVSKNLETEQVLVSERSYILKGKRSYDFK